MRGNFLPAIVVAAASFTLFRSVYLRRGRPAIRAALAIAALVLSVPARQMGSTVRGTDVWYLKRALNAHGLEHRFLSLKSPRDAPVPSMLGVTLTGIPHVVVLLRKDAQGLMNAVSMIGRREYAWDVFRCCYRPDGSCVTIRRTSLQPSPGKKGCLYYPLLAQGGPGGGYSDSVHIPL